MPPNFYSDVHALYSDVTHMIGNLVHHHSSTTSILDRTTSTTLPTSLMTSSAIISSLSSASGSSASGSSSVIYSASSTSISTISISASTSSTSSTSTASSPGLPTPRPDHGSLRLMFIVFAFGAATMLALVLLSPLVLKFCTFFKNCMNVFVRNSTFSSDSDLGLTSEAFALQENIDRDDRRHGLNKSAKLRILWYMFFYSEDFDEARLRYVKRQFLLNGIGEDGQPLDPKYVRVN